MRPHQRRSDGSAADQLDELSLNQVLRAWNSTSACAGDSSRPAASDGAIVITGAANRAAKAREAVEIRIVQAIGMDPLWSDPSIRI